MDLASIAVCAQYNAGAGTQSHNGHLANLFIPRANKSRRTHSMARDRERIDRLEIALKEAGLDAIACALPANVLLLSGYFPVIGKSVAVMTRDREVTLIVPEDERELADSDTADNLVTFRPEAADGLGRAIAQLGLDGAVVGYECGATMEPISYV